MSTEIVKLPSQLDGQAVSGLRDMLEKANAGGNTVMDASEVTILGGLCLQVILASKLKVVNPSTKAAEALSLFGVQGLIASPSSDVEA